MTQAQGELFANLGADAVLSNQRILWRERARGILRRLCTSSPTITADDLRRAAARILREPHHPNAWSALIRQASRDGWIESLDHWIASERVKARGRVIQVWKSNLFGRRVVSDE